MKKVSLLLLLCLPGAGYLNAQKNVRLSTKTPPVFVPIKEVVPIGKPATDAALNTAKSGIAFINGSFELNTGQCLINASNQAITSNVAATTAYGCANEIDLMNNSCGWGTALSGNYFLCLANGSTTCPDACTMKLTANLVPGETYRICYFDRGYDDRQGCCPPGVPLEIGVSTNSAAQGVVVYTSPVPRTNVWKHRSFTFVAPNNGKYISFQAKYGYSRWTHIDSLNIIHVKSTTALITSNEVSSIEKDVTTFSADMLPNPTRSIAILKVTNATNLVQVSLLNMQGKLIWQSAKSFQNSFAIDASHLNRGVYMVLVTSGKENKILKLVKE